MMWRFDDDDENMEIPDGIAMADCCRVVVLTPLPRPDPPSAGDK